MEQDEEQSESDELKPTFRIRFTIKNNSPTAANSNDSPASGDNDNYNHCDQATTYPQCETQNSCNCEINNRHRREQHQCNHHHHHYCQQRQNSPEPSTAFRSCGHQQKLPDQKKKLFNFIKPQNHKSSLFVNLSDSNHENENQQQNDNNHHLFISPDLNHIAAATPPSPTAEPTLCSSSFDPNLIEDTSIEPILLEVNKTGTPREDDATMSQGCNFINSWVTASRRRSASVTPTPPSNLATSNNTQSRLTSSSTNLAEPSNALTNRSPSGNHLTVGVSNETICPNEPTHVNKGPTRMNDGYVQHSDLSMHSLEIDIYPEDTESLYYSSAINACHPINLDDILQIDLDDLRLEEECTNLENQVQLWEQKVEDLERKRFAEDVPRTLVENVLKQRKKLRELEFEIYKLTLESEDSDGRSQPLSLSPNDSSFDENKDNLTGRFGSHIRPGQENTADILDAIPPSGSLQHRQYLNKASTGTDSSGYSQLPTFEQHKHQMQSQQHLIASSDESCSNFEAHIRRRDHHHYYHHQQQQQRHHRQQKSSPIRPDHFKSDFGGIVSQDSSSTPSSDSPH